MPAVATRGVVLRGTRYSVLGMFDLRFGCVHYRAVEGSIASDEFYDMIIKDVVRRAPRASGHDCAPDRGARSRRCP